MFICKILLQVLELGKTQRLSSQYIARAVGRIGQICLNVENSLTREELDHQVFMLIVILNAGTKF